MPLFPVAYSIVDVFTDTQFAGNPVAVIHDARGVSTEQMLKIAREFGFSETTFILPPRTDAQTARVRIFTPLEEIPFAGHPNIGTAFVISQQQTVTRPAVAGRLIFDEWGGEVPVDLLTDGSRVVGAAIDAPQGLQILGEAPHGRMARCLAIEPQGVVLDHFRPCVASVGLPFAFVQLRTVEALGEISPDIHAFREAAKAGPKTVDGFAICAFVIVKETPESLHFRSRVLSPLGHPPEDPATGSASGALAALLSRSLGKGVRCHITQGVEMGRPSDIVVDALFDSDRIVISGRCVAVSTGTLSIR